MAEIHSYYEEEDISEYHLQKAQDKLHSFHIGPFEDLREITRQRRSEAASRAKDMELSVPEQMKALHEERDYQEQYLEACESLHELTIEHYRLSAERVEGILHRIMEDRSCLGKTWDSKAEQRVDRIENKLNKAIVNMLKTQCRRLADQKDR